jgi:hypothetical protein
VVYVEQGQVVLSFYNEALKTWSRELLPIYSSAIRSLAVGNQRGRFRWLALHTAENRVFIARFNSAAQVLGVDEASHLTPLAGETLLGPRS